MKKIILSILSLSLLTGVANAATATVNGTTEAEIFNGITMEITTPLSLGTIIIGTTDGGVYLTSSGMSNDVGANHTFLGDATVGVVSFTGEPYLILTLEIEGGTEWVNGANTLTGDVGFGEDPLVELGSNGQASTILVGSLTLAADTPAGLYETTYTATANY